jgi:elongation factor Ts
MMECKKALQEAGGDPGEAEKILRKRGIALAAKKADRAAGEGTIAAEIAGQERPPLEVNCETDFAARNEDFQALVKETAQLALAQKPGRRGRAARGPSLRRQDGGPARPGAGGAHRREHRGRRLSPLRREEPGTGRRLRPHRRQDRRPPGDRRRFRDEVARLARDVAMHVAAASPRFARRRRSPRRTWTWSGRSPATRP